MIKATFPITVRWRLSEDSDVQWILQRANLKAKHDRNRWQSVAYCGTREGLLEVALSHHGVILSDAAALSLNRHFPDNPHIQGNRTAVAPSREVQPFRSHPMA